MFGFSLQLGVTHLKVISSRSLDFDGQASNHLVMFTLCRVHSSRHCCSLAAGFLLLDAKQSPKRMLMLNGGVPTSDPLLIPYKSHEAIKDP